MYSYETRYTYRSHRANQCLGCMSQTPPNRKSVIKGFAYNACCGICDTPRIFNRLPPNSVKMISRDWGCKNVKEFLISLTVWSWRGDELWQDLINRKCLNLFTLSDIDQTSADCLSYDADRIAVTIRKFRKFFLLSMLWIQHVIFIRLGWNFIRILLKHRCKTVKGLLIS